MSASEPTASAPFARIEAHDLGGVGRDEADEVVEAVAALFDRLGVDQRQARLDPGIAAGRVVDAPPLQFDAQRAADLVGGDGLDRAVIGRLPQRLLVLGEFERRVGVVDLAVRLFVVLGIVHQVLVQGFAVDRHALGARRGDRATPVAAEVCIM